MSLVPNFEGRSRLLVTLNLGIWKHKWRMFVSFSAVFDCCISLPRLFQPVFNFASRIGCLQLRERLLKLMVIVLGEISHLRRGTIYRLWSRDCKEVNNPRLNLQHYLWKDVVGFNIHPDIPVHDRKGFSVADVGAGTG